MMLKKGLIFLWACLAACCFLACSSRPTEPVATDSQGHLIRLNDYLGRWVFINYWATWCAPCVTEMSALNALYHNHAARVMVLGVNYDHLDSEQINQIAKKRQIDYPLFSTLSLKHWGIHDFPVLPMTFVFNPQGRLVKTIQGPQTEAQFWKIVQRHA